MAWAKAITRQIRLSLYRANENTAQVKMCGISKIDFLMTVVPQFCA